MRALINRFLRVQYAYDDPIDRQRAQALLYINALLIVINVLFVSIFVVLGLVSGRPIAGDELLGIPGLFIFFIIPTLIQTGRLDAASVFFVGLLVVTTTPPVFERVTTTVSIIVLIPVLVAGLLLRWRGSVTTAALISLIVLRGALIESQTGAENVVLSAVLLLAMIWAIVVLLLSFASTVQNFARGYAGELGQLRQVALRGMGFMPNLDEVGLSLNIIDVIRDDLKQDFVQVLLLNNDAQIIGRVYRTLNADEAYSTEIDAFQQHAGIQQVIEKQTPLYLRDGDDAYNAHWLAGIRTGALLPAGYENNVVAIIDVQNARYTTLTDDMLRTLEILAAQLGTAIAYYRERTETRQLLQQRDETILNQQNRLRQLEHIRRYASMQEWDRYLQQRGVEMLGYDWHGTADLITADHVPENMQAALESGEWVIERDEAHQHITVPVDLQGQWLGALVFTLPAETQITRRERDLVRGVIQRFVLALENQRLLEETQLQAHRKSTANDIGGLLLTRTNMDDLLTLAAQRFNEAIGAVGTRIHLQPSAPQTEGDGKR